MDQQYHFYALVSRMKTIRRWSLMRNSVTENVQEHSLMTAVIAHGLCLIKNTLFGGAVDANKVATMAMFHDMTEVFTGDMPTPVKYYNPEISKAYKQIESVAKEKILGRLPQELTAAYRDVLNMQDTDEYEKRIIRAADKITAYIKCVEEQHSGNTEFDKAKLSLKKTIDGFTDMPEVTYFMQRFMNAFGLTLDEI